MVVLQHFVTHTSIYLLIIEFNGNEDSITDYFTGSVRQARQVRKKCEQLNNELLKRKIYRNYRIVIEK